jgi:signal transduction histidine kinase
MKKTNSARLQLQNRASMLISLSLITPLIVFILLSFFIYRYLLFQNDLQLVSRIRNYIQSTVNKVKNNEEQAFIHSCREELDQKIITEDIIQNMFYNDHYLLIKKDETYTDLDLDKNQIQSFHEYVKMNSEFSSYYLYKNELFSVYNFSFEDSDLIVFKPFELPSVNSIFLLAYVQFHTIDDVELQMKPIRDQFYTHDDEQIVSYEKVYSIFAEPIGWFTITLNREFNLPFSQTLWIAGLMAIFLAILIGLILSKITANIILTPIESLSFEMNEIAKNPLSSASLRSEKYKDHTILIESFNNILKSFKDIFGRVQQYEYIVTNLSEGVFWADQKGKIHLTNTAFESLQLPSNKSFFEFFQWDDFHSPLDMKQVELNDRTYMIFVNEVESETVKNYIGVVSDITYQRKNEELRVRLQLELSRARRLAELGLLIEGISHNMNAPLHNLLGYAQLMREDLPENTDVEKIIENGNRLAEIVKSLLNRMSAEISANVKRYNISQLVKLEIEYFQNHLFFKNKVKKEIILQEDLPKIKFIYSDISQVVANILNNAVDAMQETEKKEMTFKTFQKEDFLMIEIQDSGVGIPEEQRKKIFEPFFTSKMNGKGYGIGLYIATELLKPYDGFLEVESEINVGTTFRIVIPIQKNQI